MIEATDTEDALERLSTLTEALAEYPDVELREKVLDVLQLVLNLHGEALRRILQIVESFPSKEQVQARMSADEVVRAILLIHELLPADLNTRVANAIDELRPFLLAQGCDVKLLSVANGHALLRLVRSGKGAPSITALKVEIEKALDAAAPDLLGVEIEGVADQVEATAGTTSALASLNRSGSNNASSARLVQIKRVPEKVDGAWVAVVRAIGFEPDQFKIIRQAELNVLVCKLDGEFYAYRNECAAEPGLPLDNALLESRVLICACHKYSYEVTRRGICRERSELHLKSLPCKVEDDKVKVAYC